MAISFVYDNRRSDRDRVYLVEGARTPILDYGKTARTIKASGLLVPTYKALMQKLSNKTGLSPIVIAALAGGNFQGWGFQNPYHPNLARYSWLEAGLPATVPGLTVQRQCGSGAEAVYQAFKELKAGNGVFYIAGGTESMSTVPYYMDSKYRYGFPFTADWLPKGLRIPKFGPLPVLVNLADDGMAPMSLLWNLLHTHMAGTAQILADLYQISREEQDAFALRSQKLARAAIEKGRFAREIAPLWIPEKGDFVYDDEHPRKTDMEKLSRLRGVLKTSDITAGNSSGINDASIALALMNGEITAELGLEPIAEIIDYSVMAVAPEQMGKGPVYAVREILSRNNLTMADIGLIELNEAFAAQALAVLKLLDVSEAEMLSKVNVNGGAIALGHPIGFTAARLIHTLALEMQDKDIEYGIATACIGGGMGFACLLRKAA